VYDGKVKIFRVAPLSFRVEGVFAARADRRTDFFESLVIDPFGFSCLNQAPPGTRPQYVCPPALEKLHQANDWRNGPKLVFF